MIFTSSSGLAQLARFSRAGGGDGDGLHMVQREKCFDSYIDYLGENLSHHIAYD